MQIAVLGDVRVVVDGRSVPVKGQPGRLLAMLALHANTPVSTSRLVDALWGDRPPPTARTALQVHISKLRRLLGQGTERRAEGVVRTATDGYALEVAEDSLDVLVFESAVDHGRKAVADGRPADAVECFERALGLWRGPVVEQFEDEPFARSAAARLESIRLDAEDALARARLEYERPEPVIELVQELVEQQPLREVRWQLLMLALYRAGRQAEALRAFQSARRTLLEEIGLEPGRELQRLEHAILTQDPSIDVSASTGRPEHNLPSVLVEIIDRGDELRGVAKAVADYRVVTIVGPAGVGKTRLALAAAVAEADASGRYPDGVWLVELAALTRAELLPLHIGGVLGLRANDDLTVTPSAALAAALADRSMLLVLDNCEHLLPECGDLVDRLVRANPRLRVLATSRRGLGVRGELRLRLSPLAVPPPSASPADVMTFGAARLFLDRVAEFDPAAEPTDEAVIATGRICRRLDGLPLALELAASWARALSIPEIAEQVEDRLDLLATNPIPGSSPPLSLADAIDGSYRRLAPGDQELFRHLGVFVGGFLLDGATAVGGKAAIAAVGRLVDASLVHVDAPDGRRRFRLLEPIREHALALLHAAGETDVVERRHAEHMAERAEAAGPTLRGPEQGAELDRIEREADNFRAALAWAVAAGECELAQRLVLALFWPWYVRGNWVEGSGWFDVVTGMPGADGSQFWAQCLAESAHAGHTFTSFASRIDRAEAALVAAERAGDVRAIGVASLALGIGLAWGGEQLDRAGAAIVRARELADQLGDEWARAWARKFEGLYTIRCGDVEKAYSMQREALARFEQFGDVFSSGHSLAYLGRTAVYLGDLDAARATLVEGARRCESVGAKGTAVHALIALAKLEADAGDRARAAELFRECLATMEAIGDVGCPAGAWRGLAGIASRDGEPDRAIGLLRRSLATSARLAHHGDLATTLVEIAGVAADAGRFELTAQLLGAVDAVSGSSGIPLEPGDDKVRHELVDRTIDALGAGRSEQLRQAAAAWSIDEAVGRALDPGYLLL